MGRAKKCICCGNKAVTEWVEIPKKSRNAQGGIGYVCDWCAEVKPRDTTSHPMPTLTDWTPDTVLVSPMLGYKLLDTTPTINGIDMEHNNIVAYARDLFGGYVTEGSSVDGMINSPYFKSLCGFRDKLGQFAKVVNLSHNHCKGAIRATCAGWKALDSNSLTNLKEAITDLLLPLINELKLDDECTKEFWGRKLDAIYNTNNCITVDTDNGLSIRFNLAKFTSVEQYMSILDFIKRVIVIVNDYLNEEIQDDTAIIKIANTYYKAINKDYAVNHRSIKTNTNRTRHGMEV